MRVVSLGSGSSGNALLVEAGSLRRTKLLIDAGLSTRTITERLLKVGVHPAQISAILVTHEHSDHTIGLPMLLKRYALPLVADSRTYGEIEKGLQSGVWRSDSGPLFSPAESASETIVVPPLAAPPAVQFQALAVGEHITIGDIQVTSFAISHDAVAPCGYLLDAGGCRACIVTDTGEVTEAMLAAMQQADLLVIEANHDRERLLRGPYPQHLKQRILGAKGHLSNEQTADAILRTWRADGIRWLWLAHLSRTNNTPRLALEGVRSRLKAAKAPLDQIHLSALPPDMGSVWDSTQLWHATSLWEMPL